MATEIYTDTARTEKDAKAIAKFWGKNGQKIIGIVKTETEYPEINATFPYTVKFCKA
jgi:hypothetical protein